MVIDPVFIYHICIKHRPPWPLPRQVYQTTAKGLELLPGGATGDNMLFTFSISP